MNNIHIQNEIKSLYQSYQPYFKIGAALNHFTFLHDNKESEIVKKHFNLIAAENATKMDNIYLSPNNFNFSIVDKFLNFGKSNQKTIHWHSLISNFQIPQWIFEENSQQISKENLSIRLKNYIQTVVDYTKDSVNSYDVVTNIFSDINNRLVDFSEGSKWNQILGEDYIQNAFNWAKEANPKADFLINESNLVQNPQKRKYFYQYVEYLISKKIPVNKIGLQLHINMEEPEIQEIANTIELFGKLGLTVGISGFEISLYNSETETTKEYTKELLEKQAERYGKLFDCFLNESKKGILTDVIFWGVTDKTSWKNNNPVEKRTDAPLLFDKNGLAKPAFFSVTK